MFKLIIALAFVAVVLATTTGTPGGFGGPGGPLMGGRGGPMGGPGGPPMGGPGGPGGSFGILEQSLTDDQKTQLQAILKNDALTKQEIQDQIKSFYQGIGGDVATKFNEMQTKMESMKTEMDSKASEATANLSDAAKTLVTQIQAVKQDMSITPAQEQEKIKALLAGATDEVKAELKPKGPMFGGFGGAFTTPSA